MEIVSIVMVIVLQILQCNCKMYIIENSINYIFIYSNYYLFLFLYIRNGYFHAPKIIIKLNANKAIPKPTASIDDSVRELRLYSEAQLNIDKLLAKLAAINEETTVRLNVAKCFETAT